jgi:MoaA/NifB/PqqE/SkfB family radical SAM enzyme
MKQGKIAIRFMPPTTPGTQALPAPLSVMRRKYEAFERFRAVLSSRPPFRKKNRSAYTNFLRAKYEAYTGAVDVKSYPYYLCMDPCDLCQLRCPTCPTGIENEGRKSHAGARFTARNNRSMMSPQLFDALMEEMGEYLFLIMFYNYGEPLLNKHLPEFIRKAAARDIETEVHTNLSLPLTDQQIDDVMGSGLDYLNASIDGFSQETYQIHRVGGTLDLVKRNLERLVAARDRLGARTIITFKMLVFRHNEHEIPAARQYCQRLGIRFLYGEAFIDNPAWLPSYRAAEQPYFSANDIQARVAQWDAAGHTDYFGEHEKRPYWSLFPKAREAEYPSFCNWHYGFSVVTAGGPVAPCCAASKDRDDFGTVVPGEVRFADVWNNDRLRKSRASFAGKAIEGLEQVDSVCLRCYFPKFVQQIYTVHDTKVIAAFYRQFRGTEPVLKTAFDLLTRTRFGHRAHALLRRGLFHPLFLAFGNGNERDTTAFVQFFEKSLQAERSAADEAATPSLPLHLRFGGGHQTGWTGSGWYEDETMGAETLRWSQGSRSIIEVLLPGGQDIRMQLTCQPFVFPGCDPQRVSVLLNGTQVDDLGLAPDRQTYEVVLPGRLTQPRLNTIELRYAYAQQPRKVLRNSSDKRMLAVAWYSIDFASLAS